VASVRCRQILTAQLHSQLHQFTTIVIILTTPLLVSCKGGFQTRPLSFDEAIALNSTTYIGTLVAALPGLNSGGNIIRDLATLLWYRPPSRFRQASSGLS
jgi:hypothetical protein